MTVEKLEIDIERNYEKEYSKIIPVEHRQKFAQFFTPLPVAYLMCQWLLNNKSLKTILEPAIGLGIFTRVLLSQKPNLEITGFDTDKKVLHSLNQIFDKDSRLKIYNKDFVTHDWDNKYDGIICNPPYFKFHDYENKQLLAEITRRLSIKLSGFTNLHSVFLIKALHQLKLNGRMAFIVPSEFLNSDYGKAVKSIMIKSGLLRHVFIIDFEQNIFEDATTTACVLLFVNDANNKNVAFTTIHNINELNHASNIINSYPNVEGDNIFNSSIIQSEIKWRAYYQEQNSKLYNDLVPFSTYGKVSRGIATGANNYFVFNKEKRDRLEIPSNYLLPCICKSADVKNSFFTKEDFEELQAKNKSSYLLNVTDTVNKKVNDYLKFGEDTKVNEVYLTKMRTPWYKLENRPPAPIWVNVFNRGGLRFIRNEAGISNLTTFHSVYINSNSGISPDLLFAYLLTDLSKKIFNDNRREYGDGLEKFEPNDINKALIPDLKKLPANDIEEILSLFHSYRNSVISNSENSEFISSINQILLKHFIKA
jgi:adenine-specific DNA-methyltransferase